MEYIKIVNQKELDLFLIANKAGLTPNLINVESFNNKFKLTMKKFSHTLFDIKDKTLYNDICDRAKILVQKLHKINIYHGDLSEENIVYDKETNKVALIDFGLSEFISSIIPDEIPELIENLYEGVKYAGPPSNDIDYLLNVELGIIEFLRL